MRKRKDKRIDSVAIIAFLAVILLGSVFKNNIYIILILLALVPIAIISVKFYSKNKKHQKYLNSGMKDVDALTGEEFEYFLSTYFKALGYKTRVTPATNDYGADLVLHIENEKIVVQAKRYKENVGIKAVQEVIGAKGYYRADKAIVVTCAYFTPNAKNLALECNVELWDRSKLKSVMEQIQGKSLIDEMKKEEDFQKIEKKCPRCGAGMKIRHGKRGDFYGCENFPDCKFTKPI